MSRLIYMIEIWGTTTENYKRKLQSVQNNAARFVLGAGRRTSTKYLMESIGWLEVKELIVYHTLCSMWKLIRRKIPLKI